MKYTIEIGERSVVVDVEGDRILVDGRPVEARLVGDGPVRRLVRGRASREFIVGRGAEPGQWRLLADGHRFEAHALDARALAVRTMGGGSRAGAAGTLKAPMPGLVLRVLVAEGQRVEAGQGVVVLEAMKMENELRAAGAGTVARVHVAAGMKVEKGTSLVEMQ